MPHHGVAGAFFCDEVDLPVPLPSGRETGWQTLVVTPPLSTATFTQWYEVMKWWVCMSGRFRKSARQSRRCHALTDNRSSRGRPLQRRVQGGRMRARAAREGIGRQPQASSSSSSSSTSAGRGTTTSIAPTCSLHFFLLLIGRPWQWQPPPPNLLLPQLPKDPSAMQLRVGPTRRTCSPTQWHKRRSMCSRHRRCREGAMVAVVDRRGDRAEEGRGKRGIKRIRELES